MSCNKTASERFNGMRCGNGKRGNYWDNSITPKCPLPHHSLCVPGRATNIVFSKLSTKKHRTDTMISAKIMEANENSEKPTRHIRRKKSAFIAQTTLFTPCFRCEPSTTFISQAAAQKCNFGSSKIRHVKHNESTLKIKEAASPSFLNQLISAKQTLWKCEGRSERVKILAHFLELRITNAWGRFYNCCSEDQSLR